MEAGLEAAEEEEEGAWITVKATRWLAAIKKNCYDIIIILLLLSRRNLSGDFIFLIFAYLVWLSISPTSFFQSTKNQLNQKVPIEPKVQQQIS